ncbi:signal peptidase I [Williamsia soli]|uniref:signal peptidase I n=1 Tax=Williamsia soli TaxID=364929 RepID=UPI001A9FAA9D|nr:signal peptidase I [Williamsia soli]
MSDRAKKIALEVTLTVGAITGVLCVFTAIVSASLGLSPLIFRSDSMSPAIDVGDVAISRSVPAGDVAAGDIVSVMRPDGTRITHRVVSIDSRVGNSTTMTLRGDANSIEDSEPYTVSTVDEVLFHIPNLGYVLSSFASPFSWAVATLFTLGLLCLAFRPDKLIRRTSQGRHTGSMSLRSRSTAIVAQGLIAVTVVAAAVVGFARTHGTLAPLTDSATAAGAVSAGRPEAPTAPLTCTTVTTGFLETSARLSWANPANHHSYAYVFTFVPVLVGPSNSAVVPASTTNPATLVVSRAYFNDVLGLALLGVYNVEVRSRVGNFLSTGRLNISVNLLLGSVSCASATGTSSAARAAPLQTTTTTTTTTSSTASSSSTTSAPPESSTFTPSSPSASEKPTTSVSAPVPTTTSDEPPTSAPPLSTAAPVPAPVPVPLPAVEVTSPGGSYVASAGGGNVVIADKQGAEEYRADIRAVKLEWLDDATLKMTDANGAATTVTREDGTWSVAG